MRLRSAPGPLFLALGLAAAAVSGFDVETHRDITKQALAMARYPFTASSILEVQNANQCIDTGPTESTPDQPCVPEAICAECQFSLAHHHFDNESFLKGSQWIVGLRDQVVVEAGQGHYVQARKLLGFALHTLQDFYAHSNWVNLGNTAIFASLLDLSNYRGGSSPSNPPLSLPGVPNGPGPCVFNDSATYSGQRVLTSGYFWVPAGALAVGSIVNLITNVGSNGGRYFGMLPPSGKCAHGLWLTDEPGLMQWTSMAQRIPGIAKDVVDTSPQSYHVVARTLAAEHSRQLIDGVLAKLPDKATIQGFTGLDVTSNLSFPVLANQLNRVGPVVVDDVYQFVADPQRHLQSIVWGRDGLLSLGRAIACGPTGTPGVTRWNHNPYIPPPLEDKNVGALVGTIYPGDCKPGPEVQNEGCMPIWTFYIGEGVSQAMPVAGDL
jgi:hypothetical protein